MRIVFWGSLDGACLLSRFVIQYGSDYGGGIYSAEGCLGGICGISRYCEVPPGSLDGFKVVATGNEWSGTIVQWHPPYRYMLEAYWFFKHQVGPGTFGAFPSSKCASGSAVDAVGWILGNRDLAACVAGGQVDVGPSPDRSESREPGSGDCFTVPVIENGDGDVLWMNSRSPGLSLSSQSDD